MKFASPTSTTVVAAVAPMLAVVLTTFILQRVIAKGGVVKIYTDTVKTVLLISNDKKHTTTLPKSGGLLKSVLYLTSRYDMTICFIFFGGLVNECSPIALLG